MADDERPDTPPEETGGEDTVEPSADPGESPAEAAEPPSAERDASTGEGADAPSPGADAPAAEEPEQLGADTEAVPEPAEPSAEAEQPGESPAAGEPGESPAADAPGQSPAADAPGESPAADAPGESAEAEEAGESAEAEEAGESAEERQRRERPKRPRRRDEKGSEETPEVVPGAHLEPDLVLEEEREDDEFSRYAVDEEEAEAEAQPAQPAEPQPVARTPMDLAADARYRATGKRKTAVARVILRPGEGSYSINGRSLEQFFPRETLRLTARQPLEAAGYAARMDVVARVHGGGVSAQAGAVRHGIARALVEADPNLRGELKRRGLLTRDARVKERKKAGLKKARKRPQFSKR
jgi:small subunit ribosomal protein S9